MGREKRPLAGLIMLYQTLSLLIVLYAAFSYINHRFIKWPPTVGIHAAAGLMHW